MGEMMREKGFPPMWIKLGVVIGERGSIGGKGIEVWAQLLTEDIEVNPNCMTHREMNKITNPNYFNQLRLDDEPKIINKKKI